MGWVQKLQEGFNQTQYKTCRIIPNSKSIEVYTQKGRKRHFEHNGGGPEFKFDRLRKVTFWVFKTELSILYLNKYLNIIGKYAGCYKNYEQNVTVNLE